MKSAKVPAVIPPKRVSETPSLPPVSGVEVLESTPKLDIFPLTLDINQSGNYELVDAWKKPHEKNWGMTFVRFVFCHKEHINRNELFPDFVAQREKLEEVFINFVAENLWATQGYLNPYFTKDGSPTGDKVLMFGCAGRTSNDASFSDSREKRADEENTACAQDAGSKVSSSRLPTQLGLTDNNIVLVTSESA